MLLKEKNEVIAQYMGEKKKVDYSTDLTKLWPVLEHISKLTRTKYRFEWYRFKVKFISGIVTIEEHDYHGIRWKYTSPETLESLKYQLFDCVWATITNLNNQEKKAET